MKLKAMRAPLTLTIVAFISFFVLSASAFAATHQSVDGTRIDYETRGSGPTLVLLHSGMMSREDLRVQIEHFAESYRVIAIDSREQGRSSTAISQISYEKMANDTVGILDELAIDRAHFFGQSDGGITALMIAHLFPERVNKFIIHGAVYHYEAYPIEQREGWLNISWDADDESQNNPNGFPGMAIEHYLLGQENLDYFEAHLKEMATMWASSPNLSIEDLNQIISPALVIVGDHFDISIPHTVEMHEALGNSQLFVAPGATHFIHQEKPDLLHSVIETFLNE